MAAFQKNPCMNFLQTTGAQSIVPSTNAETLAILYVMKLMIKHWLACCRRPMQPHRLALCSLGILSSYAIRPCARRFAATCFPKRKRPEGITKMSGRNYTNDLRLKEL